MAGGLALGGKLRLDTNVPRGAGGTDAVMDWIATFFVLLWIIGLFMLVFGRK